MGARFGLPQLLSNIELVMASESASCGARNCFLKLRLPSPYLGTQKRCLLKLQRAQSEPPFKPHPWSRTEPKIVPMTTLFGALSGSTAPPAFSGHRLSPAAFLRFLQPLHFY